MTSSSWKLSWNLASFYKESWFNIFTWKSHQHLKTTQENSVSIPSLLIKSQILVFKRKVLSNLHLKLWDSWIESYFYLLKIHQWEFIIWRMFLCFDSTLRPCAHENWNLMKTFIKLLHWNCNFVSSNFLLFPCFILAYELSLIYEW